MYEIQKMQKCHEVTFVLCSLLNMPITFQVESDTDTFSCSSLEFTLSLCNRIKQGITSRKRIPEKLKITQKIAWICGIRISYISHDSVKSMKYTFNLAMF